MVRPYLDELTSKTSSLAYLPTREVELCQQNKTTQRLLCGAYYHNLPTSTRINTTIFVADDRSFKHYSRLIGTDFDSNQEEESIVKRRKQIYATSTYSIIRITK